VSEQRFKGVTWSFGAASSDSSETYRQLEKAETLRRQGELDRARTLCEPLVARHPDYYGALHTLGLIYADKGQYPQALGCLVRAVMLNPRSWQALTALSTVYLELGASEMAAQSLEQARLINPRDASIFGTLGEIYQAEREYELAYDAYRSALDLDPSLEIAAIGFGMCSRELGRYAEAAKVFEGLVKRGSRSLTVLAALSSLPASSVSLDVLSELKKITADKNANKAEFDNSIAVIKAEALDRAGRPQEAWQSLVPANRSIYLARQQDVRDVGETQRKSLARLKTKQIKPASVAAKTISLFILGPSRSGKSTMETLIATLDGVKRGYENPIVENAIRRTFQSAGLLTDRAFEMLPPTLDSVCQEIYMEELGRRAGSAKVFTNTHPARIHDAARVAAAFPGVRFIFVKRNLDDNMLRIFMRLYAIGNSYSYDLKATREHLLWYHQMIDTLAEKLPVISRVIQYEDIIADPAAALRLAADLCGLAVKDGPLPEHGDDRNCAAPYRALITTALEHET
jgi:tetratricopeptide (TPR) repeat protein